MKKQNGILQRLGALLMAFAILVSMCPISVGATGTDGSTPFRYQIVRTPINDEGGTLDHYEYSVKFANGFVDPDNGSVEYWWYEKGVTDQTTPDPVNPPTDRVKDDRDNLYYQKGTKIHTSDAIRTVKVNVKTAGLTLVGGLLSTTGGEGAIAESDEFTWGAETAKGAPKPVYIGVPFAMNAATPDKNSGLGGGVSISTEDVFGFQVDPASGGKFVPTLNNEIGDKSVTRKHFVHSTWRATEHLSTTLKWPDYNPTVTVNGTEYSSGQTVYVDNTATVKVFVSDACGVISKDYLPKVAESNAWVDETGGWSNTVALDATATVKVGDYRLKVVVDSAEPTISNAVAYVDASEKTVVKFDYTVGESKIKEVTINGATVTPTYDTGTNTATVTLNDYTSSNVTITLTSNAGKSCTETVDVTAKLEVALGDPDAGTIVSGSYINKASDIRVNVTGVPSGGSATAKVGENTYTVTSGVATLPFEANGKAVTVTDNLGRTASITLPNYTLDTDGPVVTITRPNDGFYPSEQKISISATDAGAGLKTADVKLIFTNKDAVTGTINGQYEYTLKNGDRLKEIQITNVYDKLDNQTPDKTETTGTTGIIIDTVAPTVTLTVSDNVRSFVGYDGKMWAVLDPVEDAETGDPKTVSITAKVSDPNLDAAGLGSDWATVSGEANTYTRTFSVDVTKQQNGTLTFEIPVKDKAGNHPESAIVQAGGEGGTSATFNWDGSKNAIAGTLYIDRRIPSENETTMAPTVTFEPSKEGSNLDGTKKLYADDVTFTATIQDDGTGVKSVIGSVNEGLSISPSNSGNQYHYEITATNTETKDAVLSVKVMDNVGNNYTYTHAFAIDGKDPVVSVTTESTEKGTDASGVKYYDQDVTYTVTATDLFYDTRIMKKNGVDFDGLTSDGKFTVKTKMDSFEVTLTDKVEKSSTASVSQMVVDKVAPVIDVMIKDGSGNVVNPATAVVNSNLTYTFRVREANLKTVKLEYRINNGDVQTINVFTKNNDLYTYSVPLTDGQKMTHWTVGAEDWARHTANKNKSADEDLLVDTTAPVVTVSRDRASDVQDNSVEYFGQEVTYKITVQDANLDKDNTKARPVIKNGDGVDVGESIGFQFISTDKLEGTFTLTDGMMLTQISIDVQDQGGNRPASVTAPSGISFTESSGIYTAEHKAVVDKTAPTAELRIEPTSESAAAGVKIEGIYTFDGKSYLKLSGNKNKDVSVTVTMTLKDANLAEPTQLEGLEIVPGYTWNANDNGNSITVSKTLTVEANKTTSAELYVVGKDILGHPLVTDAVTGGVMQTDGTYQIPHYLAASEPGTVAFDLVLDNRAPTTGSDTDAPVIHVAPDTKLTSSNGNPLYNAPFNFTATIREDTANKSGLDKISYTITDDSGVVTPQDSGSSLSNIAGGIYSENLSIPVALTRNPGETNSAKLEIQAMDKSGNAVEMSKAFAVDNLAPRVNASFGDEKATNGNFFNAPRTATVTVEDINLTEAIASVSGTQNTFDNDTWAGTGNTKTNTVTFDPGDGEVGVYEFSLSSKDLAENEANVVYTGDAPRQFIIDRKAPTVTVTKTTAATCYTTTAETNKMDFYNQPVTYSFEIQDDYLSDAAGGTQKVNITYTINGASKTISLPAKDGGLTYSNVDGDTYTYSFTLNDEDVLSNITVEVVDNAGNRFQSISGGVDFDENGAYSGNPVKVDTVAPVVKVVRGGAEAVQEGLNGYNIYGAEQTFTITVSDKNLVETKWVATNGTVINGSSYQAAYQLNSAGIDQPKQKLDLAVSENGREASFTVTGDVSDLINYIQFAVKDAAGNKAVFDADASNLSFAENADTMVFAYNGNQMIVDTKAPTANFYVKVDRVEVDGVEVDGENSNKVDGYYTEREGAVFIKLKDPTDGTETEKTDITVTAYLEISDWNLSFGKDDANTVKSNIDGTLAGLPENDWEDGYKIHKDGKVVFSQTFTVKYNETQKIEWNLDISDLAGHKLVQDDLTIQDLNGTRATSNPLKVDDQGKLTGVVTLDRRQPTSGNDTDAPYIELTRNTSSASDDRQLYNSNFSYTLNVNDGVISESIDEDTLRKNNAGLKSVQWWLQNCEGFVDSQEFISVDSHGDSEIADGTFNYNKRISFTVGVNECNTCELYVVAEDNVGNKITHVEKFAVDTLAPRVKVVYDNNDVRNELYFRADRHATVSIEDINFNPAGTTINTEVTPSNWVLDGDNRYKAVCTYDVDGDYTFSMKSTDLAKNTTHDENVVYDGAAPRKFTLDKTNPVINVTYNPANVSGKDEMGTLYYNVDTTASIVIHEHNFRAADVVSDFNNGKRLGEFTNGENDNHRASVLFDQDNRYKFSVSYTDLAGNPAETYESPVFSVDTTAPVIDITAGDMTNAHLNIVADDLVLQIRVKDEELNLESYAVKVTYQNNNFQWITLDRKDYWSETSEDGGNTIYINFANILKEKSNDGVYTVEVSGRDYAGNTTQLTPSLVFSLNRFGSSFMTKDPFTIDFLRPSTDNIVYHNSVAQSLVFQEINPNRVFEDETHKQEGSALTLMVNGVSRRLVRDQDYTVTIEQHSEGDQAWFVYTYAVNPKAFMDGGELRNGRNTILIYGVDEAGNQNTNESNAPEAEQLTDGGVYTGKIEFVLDTMPPIITTVGIESNKVYNVEYQQMKIDISDSTPVSVKVHLNDQELTLSENPGENSAVWMTKDEVMGTYTVNIPQDNTLFSKKTVQVVAVDSAKNVSEITVQDFYVTTNLFVRLLSNFWLLGGSVLALAGAGTLTVLMIRKKKVIK